MDDMTMLKKCRQCKKELPDTYGFGTKFCIQCTRNQKSRRAMERELRRKQRKKFYAQRVLFTVPDLVKEADKVFSVFIRQRDKGRCFTCGLILPWLRMQNGHYFSRLNMSTRFDEINCNCQCPDCNQFKSGNREAYKMAIIRKYGPAELEALERRKNTIKKFSPAELRKIIDFYKPKIVWTKK